MTELLILLALLFFFFLMGVPVAFSLGATSVIGIIAFIGTKQLSQIINITFSQSTSLSLMVAPLFILMAEFMVKGGLAKEIFTVLSKWLKKIPGSLAVSNILACSLFAALCGSSPVTAATIGKISIPQMVQNGYDKRFSMGSTVGGGVIGILIPPSITLVVYGIITETSITKLFAAGVVPGILLAVIFCAYIILAVKLKPGIVNNGGIADNSDTGKTSVLKDFISILPSIILILLVLGTMFLGYVTPTEAAGVGALGEFVILLVMRRLNWQVLKDALTDTANTSAMIMFLMIGGLTFSYLLSALGIPQQVTSLLLGLNTSKWVILFLIIVLWLILGALLDPGSMIIITMPLLFGPMVELGFDPIWIGVVSTVAVSVGMMTPPIGLNLFVVKGITNSPFEEVVAGTMPFLAVILIFLLILIVFPGIVTFMPNLISG